MRMIGVSFSLLCLTVLNTIPTVDAVLPKLALDVRFENTNADTNTNTNAASVVTNTMFLSHALFGFQPDMMHNTAAQLELTVTYPPDELTNALLCNSMTATEIAQSQLPVNSLLMVPRGTCTFEQKVVAAELLGAAAVIVYGTVSSRYSLNETAANVTGDPDNYEYTKADILYPLPKHDYDCDKGRVWIDADSIVMDNPLPYNHQVNDKVLTGDSATNVCGSSDTSSSSSSSFGDQCASNSCLLTGNITGGKLEACCAWDLHIWLYPDMTLATPPVISIPAAYMTAAQALELMTMDVQSKTAGSSTTKMTVQLYARWRPAYNSSAVLIWLLGAAICALAAHLSASDYHKVTKRVIQRKARREAAANNNDAEQQRSPRRQPQQQQQQQYAQPEEVLELTAAHAAGFIVMASTSLLTLFYFQIYGIVKVFYAFGCSTAVSQVIMFPAYTAAMKWSGKRDVIVWRTGTEDFGDISVRDIATHAAGFGLGLIWLILAFTVRDAENLTFFWVMQDVFGACMCITFLKVIRLNSIRVASILLIVAFFYDIFFVFVTPYLFHGKSVMITVATSGGPPKADALWCEKYPDDKDCQGGNPLPMLLAIPKLFDFVGGSSLLGLGDIVLPGLLLSFAARFDAAKNLLGVMGGGRGGTNQSYNCPEQQCFSGTCAAFLCKGGYFAPLVVAYAVGLAMANTAVYVMKMGQPALLYLVPCCLGTMVYIGWRRKELQQLWDGPRVLRAADDVVFGQYSPSATSPSAHQQQHTPLPVEEGQDGDDVLAAVPPSASDDDHATEGDLPLLKVRGDSNDSIP